MNRAELEAKRIRLWVELQTAFNLPHGPERNARFAAAQAAIKAVDVELAGFQRIHGGPSA